MSEAENNAKIVIDMNLFPSTEEVHRCSAIYDLFDRHLGRYNVPPQVISSVVTELLLAGRVMGARQADRRDQADFNATIDKNAEVYAKQQHGANAKALGLEDWN